METECNQDLNKQCCLTAQQTLTVQVKLPPRPDLAQAEKLQCGYVDC